MIPTKGLPLNDAVKKILGQAGTKVKLTVQREGVEQAAGVRDHPRPGRGRAVLGSSGKRTTTGTT